MVLLHTPKKDESIQLPNFTLKNIDGNMLSNQNIIGKKGTAIFFICNHCPYVKAIITRLVSAAKELQEAGIGVAAIMSNDFDAYPDDNFENMQKFAIEHGFTFPYLIDETQEVAREFDAICTPDLFGFNTEGQLQYRGRLDSAGAGKYDTNTIPELKNAMMQIAETGIGPQNQSASMGCSIKWRN